VGSSVLEHFPSSHLSPNTLAYDLLCGEGAATEPRTTRGRHPERLKPPDSRVKDPEISVGASALDDPPIILSSLGHLDRLGLAFTIADADAREVEPSGIEARRPCMHDFVAAVAVVYVVFGCSGLSCDFVAAVAVV
jgi:hypothetical protein